MFNEDDILEQYTEKGEINKIFNLIKNSRIIKTSHFYNRIILRDVPEELIDKTFPLVEKIKLIDKRKHKKDIGYDLYYKISNTRTLKLCFIPLKNKTLFVNAILRYRKWQGSIRTLDRRRN